MAVDYARADGKPVNEKLRCNFFGCSCRDNEQEPGITCNDYKVRFLCQCKHNTNPDNPSKCEFFVNADTIQILIIRVSAISLSMQTQYKS